MSELKVVENGLVPVYETSTGEKVVYGTELYECLGSKRQYADWIKSRFVECDAIEDEDYQAFSQNYEKPTGGRPKREYIIKLDIAKEMAMLERNEKGKQVRRYFIRVEREYKEKQKDVVGVSQEIAEILRGFDERIKKLESIEKYPTINTNPFNPRKSIAEGRLKKLNDLVSDVAGRYGYDRNKTLHYLYQTIEEDIGVSMDAYLQIYRYESHNRDACLLHVITANDKLYDKAVSLCEDAISRKKVFG